MARIDPRRAKIHRSYTIAEAAALFGVHRNTVRHWISGGLAVLRQGRLVLILGGDLRSFLERRRATRRRSCGVGRLYCLKCREPQRPAAGTLRVIESGRATANVTGLCDACGTRMFRRVSPANLASKRAVGRPVKPQTRQQFTLAEADAERARLAQEAPSMGWSAPQLRAKQAWVTMRTVGWVAPCTQSAKG